MLTRTRHASLALADADFGQRFAHRLPGDSGSGQRPRQVFESCWSAVSPTPVAAPQLLAWSDAAAELLGLRAPENPREAAEVAAILAGNRLLPGMRPIAACYGGHQFGQWVGQLGDGRAISLGDLRGGDGQRWEMQLKGAGPTPYSRHADGRAVLRSSLREFLCSEAMHHLGVPTTRALALVASGEGVVRDLFYDGRPRVEPGAIVTRLAPSFVRFGNFELFAARGDVVRLRQLADYVIAEHFPELGDRRDPDIYALWFAEVARRTAILMAHWLRVGFVHGVMNTDNLSILGLTIDYGPFGWLDHFDPEFTPNTSDRGGRYAWGEQPGIAQWNLLRLAEALLPLVGDAEALAGGLEIYSGAFAQEWAFQSLSKLGLYPGSDLEAELAFVGELLHTLALSEVDTTLFFRALMREEALQLPAAGLPPVLAACCYLPVEALPRRFVADLRDWLLAYQVRLAADGIDQSLRAARMAAANPWLLPRNHLLHAAIVRAEAGDVGGIAELLDALRQPYREQPQYAHLAGKRPDWARRTPGCLALSCSS